MPQCYQISDIAPSQYYITFLRLLHISLYHLHQGIRVNVNLCYADFPMCFNVLVLNAIGFPYFPRASEASLPTPSTSRKRLHSPSPDTSSWESPSPSSSKAFKNEIQQSRPRETSPHCLFRNQSPPSPSADEKLKTSM